MTPQQAMARSSILGDYRRLALSLDLDPLKLMRLVGLHRRLLADPELSVPMSAVVELLEVTALTSRIDDFGLRLGEARGLPDLGPVTLMLREEATVRDALRTLIAFFHLHAAAIYLHLEDDTLPMVTLDLVVPGTLQCRQAMETSVASLTSLLRWLLGHGWAPASVAFTHGPPRSMARYARFFRCPVNFLQEFNGVVLYPKDLERKLPASSPAMRRPVERYLRTVDNASGDNYIRRVEQIITLSLHRGETRADVIAEYLGTDRRTLNRRLARVQSNYSSVLNSVRKTLATQHLLGSGRPVSEISALIGFASVSSFGIWFRKSFGISPTAWRRRQTTKAHRALSH